MAMATVQVLATGVVGVVVSGFVLAHSTRRRIRYGMVWGTVCVVAFTILVALGV